MRLRRVQMEQIAARIVRELEAGRLVRTESGEEITAELVRIFQENIDAEEALDGEVHEIMRTHSEEMASGEIQYHEMFRMIKKKLAKEKKFPL